MVRGLLFQHLGTKTTNARSPFVLKQSMGTSSRHCLAEILWTKPFREIGVEYHTSLGLLFGIQHLPLTFQKGY